MKALMLKPFPSKKSQGISQSLGEGKSILKAAQKLAQLIESDALAKAEALQKKVLSIAMNTAQNESEQIISKAREAYSRIVLESKEQILRLVLAIAEEVIGEAIVKHPESIIARLNRALADSLKAAGATIELNELDLKTVENLLSSNLEQQTSAQSWKLSVNPDLKRGEFNLVADQCLIHSSPSLHFNNISKKLLGSNQRKHQ